MSKKLRKEEVPMGKMNNLSLELEELRKSTNKLSEILSTVSDIITSINDIVGSIESAFSSSPEKPKENKKSVTLEEAKSAAKEMLDGKSFGDSGKTIVIEEFLDGFELSVFAILQICVGYAGNFRSDFV